MGATTEGTTSRAEQREATRERIVEAALEGFAERGFRGASTRDIARRAGANQGLLTYHFKSKDALWRAAADRIFGLLRKSLEEQLEGLEFAEVRDRNREEIRAFVRFAAEHPELFRLMVDEGKNSSERMEWLVENHLEPIYEGFWQGRDAVPDESLLPHAYYVLAGAGSLIFAVAPECRRLTGLDPAAREVVETHADFVAGLLLP